MPANYDPVAGYQAAMDLFGKRRALKPVLTPGQIVTQQANAFNPKKSADSAAVAGATPNVPGVATGLGGAQQQAAPPPQPPPQQQAGAGMFGAAPQGQMGSFGSLAGAQGASREASAEAAATAATEKRREGTASREAQAETGWTGSGFGPAPKQDYELDQSGYEGSGAYEGKEFTGKEKEWSAPDKMNVPTDEGTPAERGEPARDDGLYAPGLEGKRPGQGKSGSRTGDPMVRDAEGNIISDATGGGRTPWVSDTREKRAADDDTKSSFPTDQGSQDALDLAREEADMNEAQRHMWEAYTGKDSMADQEYNAQLAAAQAARDAMQERLNRAAGAVGGSSAAQVVGTGANIYGYGQAVGDIEKQRYEREMQELAGAERVAEATTRREQEEKDRAERQSSLFQTAQSYFRERGWTLAPDGNVYDANGKKVPREKMSQDDIDALNAYLYGAGDVEGKPPTSDKEFTAPERAAANTPQGAYDYAKENGATDAEAAKIKELMEQGKYDEVDALIAEIKKRKGDGGGIMSELSKQTEGEDKGILERAGETAGDILDWVNPFD